MANNKRRYDNAEEYNDDYNPTENYDAQVDYEDLEDKWYVIQDEYRERYLDLTDEDVEVVPGRFDRTLDRIGRRRGKTPIEIRSEIENW